MHRIRSDAMSAMYEYTGRPLAALIRWFLRIVGITSVQKIIRGERIRLPIYGHSLRSLFFNHKYLDDYEEHYFTAVLNQLHSGDIVFDIGAFQGIYTLFMARIVGPSGKVVAFEPHPGYNRVISETARLNHLDNVIVVLQALGGSISRIRFWIEAQESSAITIRGKYQHSIEVQMTTVDDFVESTGYAPQVMKIDVEGFELPVLKGAEETLATCRAICCEIHPVKMAALGDSQEQLVQMLGEKGYKIIYEYRPLKYKQDPNRPYNVIFEKR